MKTEKTISEAEVSFDGTNAFLSDGTLLKTSQKFLLKCKTCEQTKVTCSGAERKKKHIGLCKSCAITEEWKDKNYRDFHCQTLKEAHNRDETKKRHGEASKKNWQDENLRKVMCVGCNSSEARAKARKTYVENLLNGRHQKSWATRKSGYYTRIDGSQVWLRSSYEFRFAKILDELGIAWRFEAKAFELKSIQKVYVPDFFIENLNTFVEIKGYWYADALEKWKSFCVEYSEIRKCVFSKNELLALEQGTTSLENLIEEKCRETTSI